MKKNMLFTLLLLSLGLNLAAFTTGDDQFAFSGFTGINLILDGTATVTPNGLLELTNGTANLNGHSFYPTPLRFRDSSNGTVQSFSVSFVFGILSSYTDLSAHGMVFLISPRKNLSDALPAQYMGFLNKQNDGNASNRIFAVEFDTIQNIEFQDINNNHVGIDINSLQSVQSNYAGYYNEEKSTFQNMSLISRDAMQVWVEYNREATQINVTMAPLGMAKPRRPLLSVTHDLSTVLQDPAYVGFSSATGPVNSRHYVLGWSLGMNGPAPAIDIANLPKLPHVGPKPRSKVLETTLPVATATFAFVVGTCIILLVRRRSRYAELREDWEVEFGPHRFAYKDLFHATKGFKDKHLLGAGGFGMVYKGVLPTSKLEVAVKRVNHESRQGMKEFIAEVVSIGRIRHRSLVQLLGYCRRKGELLLVYDYMSNGSLDKYLFCEENKPVLDWAKRFRIINSVASGLLYLHERWEKVVIHRDIKASNVLLDEEMNGRLGDFGLARLYDRGIDPHTTHVVGTMGYLAPELIRTGKATPLTDVFAFGIFLLEVTCGQRPVKQDAQGNHVFLVDSVLGHWQKGSLVEMVDLRLQGDCNVDEACSVLRLGLLCSHPTASVRPSMQQVAHYLDGEMPLPELSSSFSTLALMQSNGLDPYIMFSPSSRMSIGTISDLSGGR